MFHVERIFKKAILILAVAIAVCSCITQKGTVSVGEYVLVPHGKVTLGHDEGLTAFIFENNQRKRPFVQFVSDKYGVGVYQDVQYTVDLDGRRFTVYVYENDELNKYFDMTQFISTMNETDQNIVGSNAKFIGLSMTDENNQDCLADGSLYKTIATNYLNNLKYEFYSL